MNDTKILELISKEKELNTQLALYETMNKEHETILKLDTPEKKQQFNFLTDSMINVKQKIASLANEIQKLDSSLSNYDKKIYGFKNDNNNRIKNLLNEIETNSIQLNQIRQTVNDYDASSKEFSKIYVSDNIKYIFWVVITLLLIYNIFTGIALPYTTNLEKFILILLVVISVYHLHIYVSNKIKSIDYNEHRNDISTFLRGDNI